MNCINVYLSADEHPTMSLTIRCPDAKAMEFGGVDTGSMKAYEHPIVAGIMKYRGFTDTRIAYRDREKTWRRDENNSPNARQLDIV